MAGVLRRFFEVLDGPDGDRALEMLSDDMRFSIVFSTDPPQAQDFSGGREEFDGYMLQRGEPAWIHHVLAESAEGDVELVLGETRQDGRVVATFVAAVRIDAQGKISRYIVGRSPGVAFDLARV